MLVRRACEINPEFSFCRRHTTTREIRSESEKKHDIFLRWAYVSAKDAQDIEDVDELETSRKKIYSIPDYCTKYSNNFSTYCLTGKLASLEGLLATFCSTYMKNCNIKGIVKEDKSTAKTEKVFPTPRPFIGALPSSTSSPKVSYCDGNMDRYKNECEKEGFQPEVFCRKFKEQCGKLDTIDADTTDDFGDDSLETPDEFEEHQSQRIEKKGEEAEEAKPEAQGVGTDEVTAYCTNYVENYNFYCVGDMSPEHEKFCNSYKKNCPDRVS